MINYALIGRQIGEIRKLKKISQAELAELADLSVPYVGYIENAKKKASLESLVAIAKVLGTTLDVLLIGNQNNGYGEYHNEIALMGDCTNYAKQVIFEQIIALKASLRNNKCLLSLQDVSFDFYWVVND